MEIREQIEYFVDTGCCRRILLEDMVEAGYAQDVAASEVNRMVEEEVLAEDTTDGNWIVVAEWMPNTALKIKQKLCVHTYEERKLTEAVGLKVCTRCGIEEYSW